MRTLTSLALVAAVGLGAAVFSKPADARVVVGVGVGLPGVAVALPTPVVYPYYRYSRLYPGRYYGYGWHRGWYHGRYWR
jgi:hypothetical protein